MTSRWPFVLFLALGPACRTNTPTPVAAPSPSDADAKATAAVLVKTLEARATASPTDADAWIDLAYAAFDAGQLDPARAAALRAQTLVYDWHPGDREGDRQNARLGYITGRIAEARGDKAAAVASYTYALRWGTNDETIARVRALDPAATAEALGWTGPVVMTGPFASPEAVCASLPPFTDFPDEQCDCTPVAIEHAAPAAPFELATLVVAGCHHSPIPNEKDWNTDHRDLHLAVKVAGKWFAGPFDESDLDRRREATIEQVSLTSNTQHRLELRYTSTIENRENGGFVDYAKRRLVVAGIGPSGKPSLLPALTETDYETTPTPASQLDPKVKPTLLQDTAVEITWPAADQLRIVRMRGEPRAVGHFIVVFP